MVEDVGPPAVLGLIRLTMPFFAVIAVRAVDERGILLAFALAFVFGVRSAGVGVGVFEREDDPS